MSVNSVYGDLMKSLILTIELVPKTSWYSNLRKHISRKDWDIIRKRVYNDQDYKCGICDDGNQRLNCHELWRYDDETHKQYLDGFIALCNMCHHIKHIGFANILASRGQLDYDEVINHFLRVNDCDKSVFIQHRADAFNIWRLRSSYDWDIDLGKYKDIIE